MKLICFDMDGVIFQDKKFWLEVHKALGTEKEGKELTLKHLKTDYAKLVEEVVGRLWKGKSAAPYLKLIKSVKYNPGIKELFFVIKKNDWATAIISSGSMDLARRAQHDLGIDYIYANELIIKDGKITGEFIWPIAAGHHKKAEIIKHLSKDTNIPLKDIVFIGDDLSDVEVFQIVGTSIAFNSPELAAKYHVKELKEIIKLL